ncbi:hypothetical protein [Cohnella rhizosphaerae]|uniref:Uncharacterized protein n=1 Tax=Cohnella rhizosphaerae TaxID=1457232 RepID=A0A9X4QU93_9BACL|nr:hypothetical protein [Cohnella rhizosphaerae]MDG0810237.1 hypothetical protein [Cohnella rhizosphaerae]
MDKDTGAAEGAGALPEAAAGCEAFAEPADEDGEVAGLLLVPHADNMAAVSVRDKTVTLDFFIFLFLPVYVNVHITSR